MSSGDITAEIGQRLNRHCRIWRQADVLTVNQLDADKVLLNLNGVNRSGSVLLVLIWLFPILVWAQIDPDERDLVQFGYNGAFEGQQPLAAYAFYYHNQPNFFSTNLTLRLAVAPVYLDSELGIHRIFGPNTDLGVGLAGGAYADDYNEIHDGQYLPTESFSGNSVELSTSLYHLFNPGDLIPLNYVLRGTAHYSFYDKADQTANNFQLPRDHGVFSVRTGLRFGGVEPTLFPALALELSIWYEGELRTHSGDYGFAADPYHLNQGSHLFWSEAALNYTLPKSQQSFSVRLTAGTSIDVDRFSAYRLGGFLPLIAEYPLSVPGFYYEEISARQFVLFNANYLLPIDHEKRWNLTADIGSAVVDYLPGESQPGNSLTGVGGGLLYHSPSDRWKIAVNYGYGIDAIRSHGRGANSIGFLLQIDLGRFPSKSFKATKPLNWSGWGHVFD